MRKIIIIPRIKLHNANSLSSPYTIGFPAMSSWLGFMHNLQLKLNQNTNFDINFKGIAISCHDITLHRYKGENDFNYSLVGTSNPLDKSGKRPSFIEEARCDLEVSIAIECNHLESDIFSEAIKPKIISLLHILKIASGDVLEFNEQKIELLTIDEQNSKGFNKLVRKLMPGFCLVSRKDLMKKEMQNGKDALDSLLEYVKTTTEVKSGERQKPKNKEQGWIVPIATGFQGITNLHQAKNTRDGNTPHRFAESIITLGEFKMPYHFDELDAMLWRYKVDIENNLYLCENNFYKINQQESKL
jgi:CRISPR-associated protein Csy2